MTIVDKLAATIADANIGAYDDAPLPFVYADLDTQNIILDNIGAPFAACAPLASGAVADEHGRYHEQATFEVFFGDLMEQALPDYNARTNEQIIDTCKKRAFKWLASVKPASGLRVAQVNSVSRAYMQFDAIVTGFMVNVTLEEVEGYGLCDYTPAPAPQPEPTPEE